MTLRTMLHYRLWYVPSKISTVFAQILYADRPSIIRRRNVAGASFPELHTFLGSIKYIILFQVEMKTVLASIQLSISFVGA